MRPLKIFLVFLIFLICFTGLSYLLPGTLSLPDIDVFFPVKLIKSEYSKPVIPTYISDNDIDTIELKTDSIVLFQTPADEAKSRLTAFLDSMLLSPGQLRIMYYGDSQLEGDRITSYLRQTLQSEYGGTGPGLLLPVMPVMYTQSVYVRSSPNWKRYNYLSYKNGEFNSRSLGPFMTVCRFLPSAMKSALPEKATVKIQPSKFSGKEAATYENFRLFYGNLFDTVVIQINTNSGITKTDTLKNGKGPLEYNLSLNHAGEIALEFIGKSSPDIYGISLESESGVIVDNIPQRGSAGLEFTMVDKTKIDSIYKVLKPDLFILQYGLNIVNNVKSDYTYYENGLFRQLMLLKEVSPKTRLLVLSITDMAHVENDSIKSFSNIGAIRDAQKRAADRAGAVFLDIYEEMGGENSIVAWGKNIPPLAQDDYTHLTYAGADSLSHLLLQSLLPSETENSAAIIDVQPTPSVKQNTAEEQLITSKENNKISGVIKLLQKRVFVFDPAKPFIFTSPAFWIFFLIVMAVYSLVYKKLFIRNAFLFVVSMFFYYKTGGVFFSLLVLVIVVDYTVGLLISGTGKKPLRRLYLFISLFSNLGILAYFKYTGFFIDSFNYIFNTELKVTDIFAQFANNNFGTSFDISTIILPVGISFFTFQSISYTIDVYRRKVEPVKSIMDFGFYVSFFPQLVAGPIVRASEFIPQLYLKYELSKREFGYALFLILKGLIKKIIISDFIATRFIDRVFDTPALYTGFENLMAVYGYGLQIYCDFSGYTDIAIGLGLLLGFRLPVNFNSPYKASDIADFWKRWHISLSRWLKDYLYIPLGGNRRGKLRTNFNLFITMLLGGLWHGASLRFIIWGALHGLGLIVNKIWTEIFPRRGYLGKFGKAIAVFITFQFVSFCWIFFRADGMDQIFMMVRQITGSFSFSTVMDVVYAYYEVFGLIAIGYIIHFLPEKVKESSRGNFIKLPLVFKLAVTLLVAAALYQMKSADIQPFIYFRF